MSKNKDLFNNITNDYTCGVNTSPCLNGIEDDMFFSFMDPKSIGISSNLKSILTLSLDKIKVPITTWSYNRISLLPNQSNFIIGNERMITKRKYKLNTIDIVEGVSLTIDFKIASGDTYTEKHIIIENTEISNIISAINKLILDDKLSIHCSLSGDYIEVAESVESYLEDLVVKQDTTNILVSVSGGMLYRHGAFRGIAMYISPIESDGVEIYENYEPVLLHTTLSADFDFSQPRKYITDLLDKGGFNKSTCVYINISDNDEDLIKSMLLYNPSENPLEILYITVT